MKAGDAVADYVLEVALARSPRATVYAATNRALGGRAALKVLEPSDDPAALTRFMREARMAGRCDSDHIVRAYSVGMEPDGQPFIAFELLEGRTLAQTALPLDPAIAVDYAAQACAGLRAMHAARYVHRDVQPANLFVAEYAKGRVVKLISLGRAHEIGAVQPPLRPDAMTHATAPERFASSVADPRTDVWSLGVTLYELLSGRRPFATSPRSVAEDAHPPIAGIPRALAAVLDRCLRKRPDERYATAAEVEDALAAVYS